jgi:hypothetical protein
VKRKYGATPIMCWSRFQSIREDVFENLKKIIAHEFLPLASVKPLSNT